MIIQSLIFNFFSSPAPWLGSILNNLQFNVQNVHVRYEDTVTDPEVPAPSSKRPFPHT